MDYFSTAKNACFSVANLSNSSLACHLRLSRPSLLTDANPDLFRGCLMFLQRQHSLTIVLILLLSSCGKMPEAPKSTSEHGPSTPAQATHAGTQRMVHRLALLAENTHPLDISFLNSQALAYLHGL